MSHLKPISDLHVDFLRVAMFPQDPENLTRKSVIRPRKRLGRNGEFSIGARILEFGVTPEEISQAGITNFAKMTPDQFYKAARETLLRKYDTVFLSIYGPWDRMNPQDQMTYIKAGVQTYKDWTDGRIIKKGEKPKTPGPKFVLALEGADAIQTMDDLNTITKLGVGSINIQYGKANKIVTEEGLTPFGNQVVTSMWEKGIVVDIAHSREGVRDQILARAQDEGRGSLLTYSHGSLDVDMDATFLPGYGLKRGLTEYQLRVAFKSGAIVGLALAKAFFKSTDALCQRTVTMLSMEGGTELTALGTDAGGVAPDWIEGRKSMPEAIDKYANMLLDKYKVGERLVNAVIRDNASAWILNPSPKAKL